MKKYILLSYTVSTMGGGQVYARNKMNFMRKNGYDSYIISAIGGDVIIDDLKPYKDNIILYFNASPLLLSTKKINNVLEIIYNLVGGLDKNTIIESNTYNTYLWGEIIAKKYNCRHFIYVIVEGFGRISKDAESFFSFKRNRKELNGVKDETYKMIFNHYPEKDNYNNRHNSFC